MWITGQVVDLGRLSDETQPPTRGLLDPAGLSCWPVLSTAEAKRDK